MNRKQFSNAGETGLDLFSVFPVVAFAVVFAGFARTFFLRFLFGSSKLPLYLYAHGLLFSGWYVLMFVQARLIASHRVDLHRRVGIVAAALAGVSLPVAIVVATRAGKRVYESHSRPFSAEAPPLALDLGACLVFALFVGLALWFRRRGDVHKRLMLLGSSGILLPAVGRIPGVFGLGGLWGLVAFTEIIPIGFIVYDTVRSKRLHPAFAWGGLAVLLSWPAFLLIGNSQSWLKFTEWLVQI